MRAASYHEGVQRVMSEVTKNLSISKYDEFLVWFEQQVPATSDVARVTPLSYNFLSRHYDDSSDIETQFAWALTRISHERETINAFHALSSRLESSVLRGDAEQIESILDIIEELIGPSIWLIEARISNDQWFKGLEAQKKTTERLRFKQRRGLASFIAHMISIRNEPSMGLSRFKSTAQDKISKFRTESLRAYLRFRLLAENPTNDFEVGSILAVEKSHSIIDIYETIVRLLQLWSTQDRESNHATLLSLALNQLQGIDDFRLRRIACIQKIHQFEIISSPIVQRLSPIKSYRIAARKLSAGHSDLNALKEAAAVGAIIRRRKSNASDGPVWKWLVRRTADMLQFDDRATIASDQVKKFCANFSYLAFFRCLSWTANNSTLNKFDPRERISADLYLNGSLYDDRVVDAVKSDNCAASADVLHQTSDSVVDPIESCMDALSQTKILLQMKQDSQAITLLTNCYSDNLPRLLRVTAKIIRARILVARGDVADSLDLMAHLAIEEKVDPVYIPLEEALGGLNWSALCPYSLNISLLICLDLYSRQKDLESLESLKRYAFDEFIATNGDKKPSELNFSALGIPQAYLVYFLKHLCVPRIMELSTLFPSSRALEEERRDVCAQLQALDKENASAYQAEIVNITHLLTIDEGIRLVDSSRIHVDTEMIRRTSIKDVQTDFARYKALVAAGIGVTDSFDTVLRLLIKTPAAEEHTLDVPENEADDLLVQIVRGLRDKFLLDPEHSLDSFLSKRVRHNSFAGQLRGPVDEAHLVTLFDSKRKRYQENEYWGARLSTLEVTQREKIRKALNEFSERFNNVSKEVPTKILRVKTTEHLQGIFDIPLDNRTLHLLRSVARDDETADEFLVTCFAVFWGRLAPSLERARTILQGNTKEAISDCFQRLRAVVANIAESDADKVGELSTEIGKASTGVLRQLDVITGWFNKRELSFSKQQYSLEEAVDITVGATLAAHRNIKPTIRKVLDPSVRINPGGLFIIADVVWVTLDNACSYSSLTSGLIVTISMQLVNGKLLRIRVENNVARGVKTSQEEKKLARICADIQSRQHIERLRAEGKSGLKKLAAMALASPDGRWSFGYNEQQNFFVELDLAFIGEIIVDGNTEPGPYMEQAIESIAG